MSSKLVQAARNGDLEIVKHLISAGDDCTANDNEAVRSASERGHLEVVKYLVSQGADITARDNYAVKWAAAWRRLEVVEYLISIGASDTEGKAILFAAREGNLELTKHLISSGTSITDESVASATVNRNLDIVVLLVSECLNNIKCNDRLIRIATDMGNKNAVRTLSVENKRLLTNIDVIRLAARDGNLEMTKALVNLGLDVGKGVEWAASNGRLEVVKYLVSIGAGYQCKEVRKLLKVKKLPESKEEMMTLIDMALVNKE